MILKPDNFTEQAQEVISRSQDLVIEYSHSQWDVEHVLLALLELEGGVPQEILQALGVPQQEMRSKLVDVLERVPKVAHEVPQIYVTPRASRLLENAKEESLRLKDEFISTEHILIATAMEPQGEVVRILQEYGVEQERLYKALMEIRGSSFLSERTYG